MLSNAVGTISGVVKGTFGVISEGFSKLSSGKNSAAQTPKGGTPLVLSRTVTLEDGANLGIINEAAESAANNKGNNNIIMLQI
jgi:hypothetical protein